MPILVHNLLDYLNPNIDKRRLLQMQFLHLYLVYV